MRVFIIETIKLSHYEINYKHIHNRRKKVCSIFEL